MRSPLIGLLLQHGHVHSTELVHQLDRDDQRSLPLHDAVKQLTAPEANDRRNSWRGVAGKARRLFPINSP